MGAAIGVVASKWYFEKKYRKMAEEEIESVKRAFQKDNEETENGVNQNDTNEVRSWSSLDLEEKKKENEKKGIKFEGEDDDYVYYSSYSRSAVNEYPKDDEPDETEEYSGLPIEISENDYITDIKYKKKEFTYFTGDDTFVNYTIDQSHDDEYDQPLVDDEYNYFGYVIDNTEFKFDDSKQVIFIRNFEGGFDCKVEKCRGRYGE